MNARISLCLALILSSVLFGCSTVQNHPADSPVVYHDSEYGLTFWLSASWRGYSVLVRQLDDEVYSPARDKLIIVGHNPMITLRHPQWQASAPYQDIPILVFTRAQWDDLNHGGLWPSIFAGGAMDELWHNQTFVFAMSSRYNAADEIEGEKEVEDIINRNCAIHPEPHLYPK
jgi:hypothetical protein